MKRLTSVTALALALTLVVSVAHAHHTTSPAARGATVAAATPAAKVAPGTPSGPVKPTTPPARGKTPSGPGMSSTPPSPPPAPKAPSGRTTTPPIQVTQTMKVDLNTATREELMRIPGIGPATVDRIVADRPFKAKSDLLSKGVVNKAQYAKLAPHVIAKQK